MQQRRQARELMRVFVAKPAPDKLVPTRDKAFSYVSKTAGWSKNCGTHAASRHLVRKG